MADRTTVRHSGSPARSRPTRLAAVWCGTLALLAIGGVLIAQDKPDNRSPVASQLERAEQRLRTLQQEADQLAREERTLLGDIQRLEVARRIKVEELARATAQVVDTQHELARVNQQVAQHEAEAAIEGPRLRARLAELYKLGRGRYVRVLFSTPSVRDARQAYRLVSAMARRDQERVAAHQTRLAAMTSARQDIQARMALLAVEQRTAEQAAAAATQALAARDALVRETDVKRDLNARLSGELLTAQQRLQGTLTSATLSPTPPLPFLAFRGDIDWPLVGAVQTSFLRAPGVGAPPINGIEIAAAEGLSVQAVHEGVAVFAGPFTGFGNLVILDHGSRNFSIYGYLSTLTISREDRVTKGQPVGTTGTSPRGTPSLYFELRVDGKPADPLQWLRAR